MSDNHPPILKRGDENDDVVLLQQKLATAGFALALSANGLFDASTAAAVADFQASRGLSVDGICGPHTWTALQEASWSLGERHLYFSQPLLRGDDVAELQLRLGSMGFDAGRVDGIFGPDTANAVEEFQLNSGLVSDAVCGEATTAALMRMSARVTPATVAAVRERAKLQQAPRRLTEQHIMIASMSTMAAVAGELATGLRRSGAAVSEVCDWPEAERVEEANRLEVDIYVGLLPSEEAACRVAYFATEGFVSPGGQRLASVLGQRLPAALGIDSADVRGMRLPVLRHTRMTAVQCLVGPPGLVQARLSPLARSIESSLTFWARRPA
ncbi:peptidoglycan-binding protein [Candidatus Poriferisocius sp.]|uniref:peptidoglycan-binding protein n=1 Tax=Candidatus Poriferisocius sp. TaxID=3101276 RepID=UPI003B02389D